MIYNKSEKCVNCGKGSFHYQCSNPIECKVPCGNTERINLDNKEYEVLAIESEPEHVPGYCWIKIFVKQVNK